MIGLMLKSTYSEYDHVAYKIKGNEASNNMLANVLPLYTHSQPLGWGQTFKYLFFLAFVLLHIKLTGMKDRTACKQIG